MASGFERGSRSANRLNQIDLSGVFLSAAVRGRVLVINTNSGAGPLVPHAMCDRTAHVLLYKPRLRSKLHPLASNPGCSDPENVEGKTSATECVQVPSWVNLHCGELSTTDH